MFGEPSNRIGCILIGFNHDRSHAGADRRCQGHLMSAVFGSTEFSHGADDAVQGLVVSRGQHGAGTSSKAFGPRFLFHFGFRKAERTFRLTKTDLNPRPVLRELCFCSLGLGQLDGQRLTVVFRRLFCQILEFNVKFPQRHAEFF